MTNISVLSEQSSPKCIGCEFSAVCVGELCAEKVHIPLLSNPFFGGPHKPEDFLRIRIKDDAMEQTLQVGDLVIAKKTSRFITDSLYVVEIEGWPGLPRVRRLQIGAKGKLYVMCDKKIYGDFEDDVTNLANVKILGYVFWTVAIRGYAGVQLPT